jgi:serine/threonine protein kinase/Tol biopolymer transport system component
MTDAPPPGLAEALRDRYVLEHELGRGGMATVYAARDVRHDRRVALKVLHPELAASLGPERFEREIHLAAQLQHPHILPVHDSGEADGRLYYVMPLVEGESLRQRLVRQGELPVAETLRILEEVVEALAYAHAHGVVHRDIKPDNIMLSGRHALITDLGVAKAVSAAERGGETLTSTGMALGTPRYMAPEQVAADPTLDHRVDIYAVGVMAYEMLTGVQPFSGATPQAVFAAQMSHLPTRPEVLRPGVPAALSDAIMQCLAPRAADRWQNAGDLLAQLERLRETGAVNASIAALTPPEPSPTARRSRPSPIWIAVAGVATAAALVALFLMRKNPGEIRFESRSPLTVEPGLEIDPAMSPDGQFVAYSAGPLIDSRIYVRQVDGGRPIAIAPNLGGAQRMPFWSPDGKRILFRSARGIEIAPALGGAPKLVVPRGMTALLPGPLSPDGRRIAFARSDSLFAMPLEGGAAVLLANGGDMHSFSWSPDGRWIAAVRGDRQSVDADVRWFFGNLGQSAVWILPALAPGTPVRVTDDRSFHASPSWLPGGRGLLYLSNADGGLDVYRVALTRSGAPAGQAERLTTGLNAHAMSMDAAGRRLAYALFEERSNVWRIPVPAHPPVSMAEAVPVTSGNQIIETFDISPDGRWLAFDSDRSGVSHIYRVPLSGGDPEQLTTDSAAHFWPRYSPDGEDISFHAFGNGIRQLFVMGADGGNPTAIPGPTGDDRTAEWRRDGRGLYYLHAFDSPGVELQFIPRDTSGRWGPPTTLMRMDVLPVAMSPDGRRLGVATSKGLIITSPQGHSERVLVPVSYRARELRPTYVSWSTDSRTLYYLAIDSLDHASIWGVDPATAQRTLLVRFDDPQREWHRYGFGAFGGQFYVTVGDQQSDIWTAGVANK